MCVCVCVQVRRYLHVVLCFSPVGDKFRIRARQFPALVNCTQLDWFHGWPHEALLSVAQRFLAGVPDIPDDVRGSMAEHMAQAHQVGVFVAGVLLHHNCISTCQIVTLLPPLLNCHLFCACSM